jgi:hypothetical protein
MTMRAVEGVPVYFHDRDVHTDREAAGYAAMAAKLYPHGELRSVDIYQAGALDALMYVWTCNGWSSHMVKRASVPK